MDQPTTSDNPDVQGLRRDRIFDAVAYSAEHGIQFAPPLPADVAGAYAETVSVKELAEAVTELTASVLSLIGDMQKLARIVDAHQEAILHINGHMLYKREVAARFVPNSLGSVND